MPQAGDVYKIREWDDMVRVCGEMFTVKEGLYDGSLIAYEKLFSAFCITQNMLEPYEDCVDDIDELEFDRLI